MTSTPAASSAATTWRTWASVNRWAIACEPSRSVESVMRRSRVMPSPPRADAAASRSPTRAAAAVMMSRLPAHGGR